MGASENAGHDSRVFVRLRGRPGGGLGDVRVSPPHCLGPASLGALAALSPGCEQRTGVLLRVTSAVTFRAWPRRSWVWQTHSHGGHSAPEMDIRQSSSDKAPSAMPSAQRGALAASENGADPPCPLQS